jgi:alpha-beta hydrolase superfamily lysophospholipase
MKPSVLIVHGAWHTPAHYQEVVNHLKQNGFEDTHCPRLPSATEILPLLATANLKGDTAAIHSAIKSLVDLARNVLVLMHSYGGVVGTNALDSLLAPQRKALGLQGGVIHIIYMAAFVQPAGSRLVDPFNGQMPYVSVPHESSAS